jgi:DNA-binding response OmpR family regulator
MDTARAPRILIVDDTPRNAELLEAYLADEDYDLRVAADGEQALRQVAEWSPDLMLLDIMMPKISGFEVCKQVKADPKTRGIAILMVTALDKPADVEKAVEAGTDDFLSKPIAKAALLHRVRSLLRVRQHKGELDRTLAYIDEMDKPGG